MRASFWSLIVFGSLLFITLPGCGASGKEGEPNASTNEIQEYLKANPDAVEKPEDVAADEAATFAAGDGTGE